VGASLAQIGEFSFILAGLGVALGLMPEEGRSLVLAAALISIAANAALFAAIEPVRRWILDRSALARRLEQSDDPLAQLPGSVDPAVLTGHVVLAGYGRIGRRIGETLRDAQIPCVVAEQNRERVDQLRAAGVPAVSGDATTPEVLVQAHVARASTLVVAIDDAPGARRMADVARTLNPSIAVVLRASSEDEAAMLRDANLGAVFLGEDELARAMSDHVTSRPRRTA
jgi:CPA2 family monovalent cation:H+ antiporter-2